MLTLNTLISLPLTNNGPSYTCERIAQAMNGGGVAANLFTPADRRLSVRTDVDVDAVVPRWAKQLPFRPSNRVTSVLCERRLLAACRSSEGPTAAFLWGDVTSELIRRLRHTNTFLVREKFNCAKMVSREILREAYSALGVPEAFPAELYDDRLIAAEMDSLRFADMIFCPSPMVAWSLKEVGIDESVLAPTSYGFEPARLAGDSRALPPIDGPTFIFTGAICVRKGAHILLEAWSRANIKGRLVLLGRLEKVIGELYAETLARPDVEHHEFTQDVGAFYRSADFFVFPSLEEGSPLVTYEAASCSLPSIVSPMGAGGVVRQGVEGTVLDSTDPDAWAAAIVEASEVADRRSEMGRAASERAAEFTWKRVGAERRQQLLTRATGEMAAPVLSTLPDDPVTIPWLSLDSLRPAYLEYRTQIGALMMKLAGAFLSFLIIFLVARSSGASVTGDYAMAVLTANMSSLLAMLGLDQIVTRAIGGDLREKRPDLARAALFATVRIVAPLSVVLAMALFIAAPLATSINASPAAMRAVAVAVFAYPMLRISVVSLRANGSILWSQFFDAAHNILILAAVVLLLVSHPMPIGAALLAGIYSAALLAMMAAAWAVLLYQIRDWPAGAKNRVRLLGNSWPLLIAGFCQASTAWIIFAIIGAWLNSAEVGAYRVVGQVVTIIALMLTTIEALVSPDLAGDFRVNDVKGAWRRHRKASYLMLLAAAGPVLACMLAPKYILHMFGAEFVSAAGALMVLSGAQIVNVLTGPIGSVMVMSGHERLSLVLSICALIISVTACALLVPVLGLIGAAMASASALVLRNILAYAIMRRKLRV